MQINNNLTENFGISKQDKINVFAIKKFRVRLEKTCCTIPKGETKNDNEGTTAAAGHGQMDRKRRRAN